MADRRHDADRDGRLSDALNKRESVTISDVQWAPADGSAPLAPAPGLKAVDPYDLIIVLAGEATLPPLTDAERAAHKVHKVAYDVALEVPPFRVVGTVHLHPGSEPERLLDRATEMFVPVVGAVAYLGDQPIGPEMDAVLVNRFYLRGIEQVDRRTGERHQRLPGRPDGRHLLAGPHALGAGPRPEGRCDACPRRGARSRTSECARFGPPDAFALTLGRAQERAGLGARDVLARLKRPNGTLTGGGAIGVPRTRSASASKSSVMRSLGNISITVRPSLAARTNSSPPDRIRAIDGIPTVRSMSATPTPLLARLITSASRSRTPSSSRSRSAERPRGSPARPA